MILREIFTSFDSSVVKQSELIYAMRDFSVMADLSDPLRGSWFRMSHWLEKDLSQTKIQL